MAPDKSKMTPVNRPMTITGGGVPYQPMTAFRAPLSPDSQFDVDTISQIGSRIRRNPLPPSGYSQQNAATNSTADTVISSGLQKSKLNALQITSGQVAIANGGTGANLQNTGGTGQVLQQSTPGGAVSVGLISFSSVQGTVAPSQIPGTLGATKMPSLTITGSTPTGSGTDVSFGNSVSSGEAGSGSVTSPTSETTGPATPRVIVKYLEIDIGGTKYWLPMMQ